MITKTAFQRTFKMSYPNSETWRRVILHAKKKETDYILRCKSYLSVSKYILDKSSADVHRDKLATNGNLETKTDMQDRMYQALLERSNKDAYIERFDARQRKQQEQSSAEINKLSVESISDDDEKENYWEN